MKLDEIPCDRSDTVLTLTPEEALSLKKLACYVSGSDALRKGSPPCLEVSRLIEFAGDLHALLVIGGGP